MVGIEAGARAVWFDVVDVVVFGAFLLRCFGIFHAAFPPMVCFRLSDFFSDDLFLSVRPMRHSLVCRSAIYAP